MYSYSHSTYSICPDWQAVMAAVFGSMDTWVLNATQGGTDFENSLLVWGGLGSIIYLAIHINPPCFITSALNHMLIKLIMFFIHVIIVIGWELLGPLIHVLFVSGSYCWAFGSSDITLMILFVPIIFRCILRRTLWEKGSRGENFLLGLNNIPGCFNFGTPKKWPHKRTGRTRDFQTYAYELFKNKVKQRPPVFTPS